MKKPPLTNADGVCIEFAGRGSFPTGTCYGPCRQMLRVRRSKSPIFMRVVSGVTSLAPVWPPKRGGMPSHLNHNPDRNLNRCCFFVHASRFTFRAPVLHSAFGEGGSGT